MLSRKQKTKKKNPQKTTFGPSLSKGICTKKELREAVDNWP